MSDYRNNFSYDNAHCEAGSFGYIYQKNKKTIDSLLKETSNCDFKHFIAFDEKKGITHIPRFDEYCQKNWKDLMTEEERYEYWEKQKEISRLIDEGIGSYERKEMHEKLEEQWKDWILTDKNIKSLHANYLNEYGNILDENAKIEERNKTLNKRNNEKYNKYIAEISTDTTSREYVIYSILSYFYDTYDCAEKTHYFAYKEKVEEVDKKVSEKTKVIYEERLVECGKNKKKFENWIKKSIANGNLEKKFRMGESEFAKVYGLFIEEYREQYGKYGWFFSRGGAYNLPEYHTGYLCKNKKVYNKYFEFLKETTEPSEMKIAEEFRVEYKSIWEYSYFPSKDSLKIDEEKTNLSIQKHKLTFWF